MKRFLLLAAGRDRPGMVAALTKVLYRHGCNLADSAMTRLASEFAILLTFETPGSFQLNKAWADFKKVEKKVGLTIYLKPLTSWEARPQASQGRPYLVSVYGGDRPGIVYHVSKLLACLRVNITDLSTHLTLKKKKSGYILLLETEVPKRLQEKILKRRLTDLAKKLNLHVTLKPLETVRL